MTRRFKPRRSCAHAAGTLTSDFCQQCGTMFPEQQQLTGAEREKRRQGLRMLMGLNKHREGGPVDGLAFQEEQRAEWQSKLDA